MTDSGSPRLSWVPGLGLGAAALIIAAALRLPVVFDEAYYWTWSKALSWSYYDHPPGIAAVLAASRRLFGEGELALRLVSVAAMVVTAASLRSACRLAVPQDPVLAGRLALLWMLGALLFMVGYLPATPDPLQGATLGLAALFVARALRAKPWAWDGFFAALLLTGGVLFKHSTALIAAGALVGGLLSTRARAQLASGRTLAGVALGLLLLGPWVATDLLSADGATQFQAWRVVQGRPLRGLSAPPILLGAMALGWGPAATWALGGAALRLPRTRDGEGAVWASGALALVLGCLVATFLGAGELNWLTPALVFGAPAGVLFVVRGGTARVRVFAGLSAATCALWLVVLVHIVYPFAPIPPHKDRTMRAVGYEGVTKVVQDVAQRYKASVVVTRGYQAASQLRFHLQDSLPVLEVASHRRSQYDRWPHPSLCPGDVAVLAWGRRDRPADLEGEALGPVLTAPRQRSGRALDPVFVQALVITGSKLCPRGQP